MAASGVRVGSPGQWAIVVASLMCSSSKTVAGTTSPLCLKHIVLNKAAYCVCTIVLEDPELPFLSPINKATSW